MATKHCLNFTCSQKHLFIGLVVLISLTFFLILIIPITATPNLSVNITRNQSPTTSPPPTTTKFAPYKPYYSVDGHYYAYLDPQGTDQSTSLFLQTKSYDYSIENNSILPVGAIPNYHQFVRANDYLLWSPNNTALALTLPDQIIIYKFNYRNKTLTKTDQQTISVVTQTPFYTNNTVFSGDSNGLFFQKEDHYYQYNITTRQTDPLPTNVRKPYPIPNSSGYLYWEDPNNGKPNRIVKTTTSHPTYWSIPEKVNRYDYRGKILLSPKQSYACIEAGSSGYWGYQLINLTKQTVVASGIQYSYCERWLNDNQVVVKEKNYYTQATVQYYLINAANGNTTLLHNTGTTE